DDLIVANAVGKILSRIQGDPAAVALHFTMHPADLPREPRACHTIAQLFACSQALHLVNIWLANTAYNVEKVAGCLRYGYIFATSFAPQYAILLAALREEAGSVVVIDDRLAHYNGEKNGIGHNSWNVYQSIGIMLDLPMSRGERRQLAKMMAGS